MSAINIIGLRHNVISLVACQKNCHASQILWAAHPAKRHIGADFPLFLAWLLVLIFCEKRVDTIPMFTIDDTGGDCIYIDAMFDQIEPGRLRQ